METQPETWGCQQSPVAGNTIPGGRCGQTIGQFGVHRVERSPAAMRISPEKSPSNNTASQPASQPRLCGGSKRKRSHCLVGENWAKQLASGRPASPRPSPNRNPGLRPPSRGSLSVLSALPRPRAIVSPQHSPSSGLRDSPATSRVPRAFPLRFWGAGWPLRMRRTLPRSRSSRRAQLPAGSGVAARLPSK